MQQGSSAGKLSVSMLSVGYCVVVISFEDLHSRVYVFWFTGEFSPATNGLIY